MKTYTTKALVLTLFTLWLGILGVPPSYAITLNEIQKLLVSNGLMINGTNWNTEPGRSMSDKGNVNDKGVDEAATTDLISLSIVGSIDKPAGQELGRGIAFLGSRMFFSGDQRDSVIYELNPDTGAIINSLNPGLGFIIGLTANPLDGLLYVEGCCGNVIQKVDPASGLVVGSLNVASVNMQGLAIYNNMLYVAENGGPFFIHEIDVNTGATLRSLNLDNFPNRPNNFTNGNVQGIEVFENTIFLNVDDAGVIPIGEIHEFSLTDLSYIGVGYTGSRAAASGYDGKYLWIDIEGEEANGLIKLAPSQVSNDLLTIEKLINHRVRTTPVTAADLLVGTRYRVDYKVTNNSPNRIYRVRVFEDGNLVCNLYDMMPGQSKQPASCTNIQDVLAGLNNVPANVTAKISGSNQELASQTNAYYNGFGNEPGELSVTHYVNDKNADTQGSAVLVNGNQAELLFRVENTGSIKLYRVKTYHDPVSPLETGWQQQCFFGTLEPDQVRYCRRTISVTETGLNKAFGRAQGEDANVNPTGFINAANPTYFNVVLP